MIVPSLVRSAAPTGNLEYGLYAFSFAISFLSRATFGDANRPTFKRSLHEIVLYLRWKHWLGLVLKVLERGPVAIIACSVLIGAISDGRLQCATTHGVLLDVSNFGWFKPIAGMHKMWGER